VGYKVIKNDPGLLIEQLSSLEEKFLEKDQPERSDYFYSTRDKYNAQMLEFDYSSYSNEWIKRAVYLIFLNKTCYNGLFRQNKKGEFNVPYGKYVNPTICDAENICAVSAALENTNIYCADFTASEKVIDENSFVYFDPPYRPLNKTSSFTGYYKEDFEDKDQRKLGLFFHNMDKRGAKLLLSNSDPKNEDPADDFFDDLYSSPKFSIERVQAKRYINCDATKRGEINELIIYNY
ncbi:MAG: Dam family site-specific DNA-(adenine-N6)-methyltransferase, partial [Candidatus Marinimicrobia bacterium]|nr:Dam family site-specific DNA-(adenine-N6)-methyltransferase [Candidatus Neomarinimicrobiota bacterium]